MSEAIQDVAIYRDGVNTSSHRSIGRWTSNWPGCYLLAIPCGRAGPEAKDVLKSRLNRVSNSSLECWTFRT